MTHAAIGTREGDEADPYAIPAMGWGKLRLKKSNTERASEIRAREAREQAKRQARIARANGLAAPSNADGDHNNTEFFEHAGPSRLSRTDVYGYDPARVQIEEPAERWDLDSGDGDEADFVCLGSTVVASGPSSNASRPGRKRKGYPGGTNNVAGPKRTDAEDDDDNGGSDSDIEFLHAAPDRRSNLATRHGGDAHVERNTARLAPTLGNVSSSMSDPADVPNRHRSRAVPNILPQPHVPPSLPAHVLDARGNLDDAAYLAHLRASAARDQHQRDRQAARLAELEAARAQVERERAEAAREASEKRERKKRRKAEKAARAAEAARQAAEEERRQREAGEAGKRWKVGVQKSYAERWEWVYDAKKAREAGAAPGAKWGFAQVPWPIYPPRTPDGLATRPITLTDLTLDAIRGFVMDMAHPPILAPTVSADAQIIRKALGKAIQTMHPDRAVRLLPWVRDADKGPVKEGIELCARLLNDLKGQM